jgi:hypothetical protein
MNKSLQIRNSTAEFLIFTAQSGELDMDSVIRKFRNTASDGKKYLTQSFAESEFEKYRIVQDRLFESDFDKVVKQLEEETRKTEDKQ